VYVQYSRFSHFRDVPWCGLCEVVIELRFSVRQCCNTRDQWLENWLGFVANGDIHGHSAREYFNLKNRARSILGYSNKKDYFNYSCPSNCICVSSYRSYLRSNEIFDVIHAPESITPSHLLFYRVFLENR
jgi:hypothetical protein